MAEVAGWLNPEASRGGRNSKRTTRGRPSGVDSRIRLGDDARDLDRAGLEVVMLIPIVIVYMP